jgi:transcriptional regulator GlxA family with amidase domain
MIDRRCVQWLALLTAISPGFVPAGAEAPAPGAEPYTWNVAIVLYDGVEVLDFAGPAEVFAAAAGFGANGADRAFNVYTVSKRREPIVSQGFIDVVPDYSIADAPRPDIVVFPGGGSGNVTGDPEWMRWVGETSAAASHVLTVCTGAFVAGRAGLLDGLDVTTFYRAIPGLAAQFPKARVVPGRRFIDNGKVITTAGVSAGIDGSLHLVARLLGRWVADRTAEYMEYKWAPESYLSMSYATFNPRLDAHGRELQQAAIAGSEGDVDGAVAIYRSLIARDRADAQAWYELARLLHVQKRYPEAIAAFREAAKGEKQRAVSLYNLACALALSGDREGAVTAAIDSYEAGFRDRATFEQDSDLDSLRSDPRFQDLLARLARL